MKNSWKALLASVVVLSTSVWTLADTATPKPAETKLTDPFENAKFRNLGPAIGGGRVTSVTGIPGQPNIYYAGAAAGGVWKTIDGGLSWKQVFDKQTTASIGAIALAPSNPSLVWVGTGESNPRNDVVTGKGVFFSSDGGLTWKSMGLENAGAVSQIIVHPTNPDIVYVGVLGHIWGTNPDRGVFRTTDGGKTWTKVLYVDDKTGVSDMVMDPSNPMVLFAGMWQFQRFPWMLVSGGENSGVYRSNDGGTTWKKLTEGLPKGQLGRIGLAIAPSNPNHVYALIQAKQGQLWDSNDLGEHWRMVSSDKRLIYRGFYFTTLYVSPENENHIYFLNYNVLESTDGGKTTRTVGANMHPDHHSFWIDPKNADRIIDGNDGGVYVSYDGAKSWRALDNLPIEQFYMVATDDERPYMICGGLQDNNGWCGPSNNFGRGVTGAEWWTAAGGDGEYIVPAGNKSGLVYAESQNGSLQVLDARTGVGDSIRPYPHGVTTMAPSDLKYRFNWTTPIIVSPTDPKTVYIGGNVIFKSTDAGRNWAPISPDLTRNDKAKQQSSGGPIDLDLSGAETFGTVLSMAISAVDQNVIWAGTDDGVVQVTRDGGKNWAKVTPPNVPEWGRLQQIEVSPFSPGTAYVAIDLHELDNNKPYVFRTHDFGKTWTAIANGLPANDPARVVRENPNRKGMLALGTDTGLFYSYDDGDHWTQVKGNFPVVPIYDIKFVKATHDLIVATHGRGLWQLDDLTVAEEFTPQLTNKELHVFGMLATPRWRSSSRHPAGTGEFVAPNPPGGISINFYLAKDAKAAGPAPSPANTNDNSTATKDDRSDENTQADSGRDNTRDRRGPVKIVITDGNGQIVRTMYAQGKKGLNRASWNMRYDGATRFNANAGQRASRAASQDEAEEERPMRGGGGDGPAVVPGTYKVAVTANGATETQTVQVEPDPRFPFDMNAAQAQLRTSLEAREWVSALNQALNRLQSLKAQIATVQAVLTPDPDSAATVNVDYKPVLDQARALQKKLNVFEQKLYRREVQDDPAGYLHYLAAFQSRLESAYRAVSGPYNQAPSATAQEELDYCHRQLTGYLGELDDLLKTDVTTFNKLALEKGASTLFAGDRIEIKGGAAKATAGQ